MNSLRDFIVFCAGADRQLLVYCPLYERHKYIAIGITVILTGVFAGMAAGYSFYTIFRSLPIAATLGLIWGFFILNIDRLILSTMQKEGKFWRELLHTMPRLVLAALIALTIAHPLKLRLFQDEILQHLTSERIEKLERLQAEFDARRTKYQEETQEQIDRSLFHRTVQDLGNQIGMLNSKQKDCEDRREEARKYHLCECAGTCGTMRYGDGPECKRTRQEYINIGADCVRERETSQRESAKLGGELSATRDRLSHHVETVEKQRSREMERLQAELQKRLANMEESFSTSFLARSETLSELSEQRPTTWRIGFFLTLLLLAVEIMPVFVKLISPFDALDALLNGVRRQHVDSADELSARLFQARRSSLFQANTEQTTDARIVMEREFETQSTQNPLEDGTRTIRLDPNTMVATTINWKRFILIICTAVGATLTTFYFANDEKTALMAGSFFIALITAVTR